LGIQEEDRKMKEVYKYTREIKEEEQQEEDGWYTSVFQRWIDLRDLFCNVGKERITLLRVENEVRMLKRLLLGIV